MALRIGAHRREVVEDDALFLLVIVERHLHAAGIFEYDARVFLAIGFLEHVCAEADALLLDCHDIDDLVLTVVVDRGIAEHQVNDAVLVADRRDFVVHSAVPVCLLDFGFLVRDVRDALSKDVGNAESLVEAEGVELGSVVLVLQRHIPRVHIEESVVRDHAAHVREKVELIVEREILIHKDLDHLTLDRVSHACYEVVVGHLVDFGEHLADMSLALLPRDFLNILGENHCA